MNATAVETVRARAQAAAPPPEPAPSKPWQAVPGALLEGVVVGYSAAGHDGQPEIPRMMSWTPRARRVVIATATGLMSAEIVLMAPLTTLWASVARPIAAAERVVLACYSPGHYGLALPDRGEDEQPEEPAGDAWQRWVSGRGQAAVEEKEAGEAEARARAAEATLNERLQAIAREREARASAAVVRRQRLAELQTAAESESPHVVALVEGREVVTPRPRKALPGTAPVAWAPPAPLVSSAP